MSCKLSDILQEIKENPSYKPHDGKFPSLSILTRYPASNLSIIVDEGERLLLGLDDDDKYSDLIKEQFISDIHQFLTENSIVINSSISSYYAQNYIVSNALYHIARSQQYEGEYLNISLNMNKSEFKYYSISFVIRLAIESKLKAMIGFKSSDVTRSVKGKKQTIKNTREFPVAKIISFLDRTKLVSSPCLFSDIKNIYSWSCRFTHDATKEYVWLRVKAIRMLSELFDFESNKRNYTKSEQDKTLCYLDGNISIEYLMSKMNEDVKLREHHKIYLSVDFFEENSGFYDRKENKWI